MTALRGLMEKASVPSEQGVGRFGLGCVGARSYLYIATATKGSQFLLVARVELQLSRAWKPV